MSCGWEGVERLQTLSSARSDSLFPFQLSTFIQDSALPFPAFQFIQDSAFLFPAFKHSNSGLCFPWRRLGDFGKANGWSLLPTSGDEIANFVFGKYFFFTIYPWTRSPVSIIHFAFHVQFLFITIVSILKPYLQLQSFTRFYFPRNSS